MKANYTSSKFARFVSAIQTAFQPVFKPQNITTIKDVELKFGSFVRTFNVDLYEGCWSYSELYEGAWGTLPTRPYFMMPTVAKEAVLKVVNALSAQPETKDVVGALMPYLGVDNLVRLTYAYYDRDTNKVICGDAHIPMGSSGEMMLGGKASEYVWTVWREVAVKCEVGVTDSRKLATGLTASVGV